MGTIGRSETECAERGRDDGGGRADGAAEVAFGPQRLMWATDWPIVENVSTYERALSVVRDEMKFLNAEDRDWMLNKTIERVWPFGA